MKTKQLAKLIRKLVKEEVQREVRSLLTEQATTTEPLKKKTVNNKQFTANKALNDILNETVSSTNYETLKTFNAEDARAGFTAMQQPINGTTSNPLPDKDVNGAPLNPTNVTPDLMKALTRDYTELVKRF